MSRISEAERYGRLFAALDRTAVDAEAWPKVCDELAGLVGGIGTMLIPTKVEQRLPGIPVSATMKERQDGYFKDGWNLRDPRAQGASLMLARGYLMDQDVIPPERMVRHPFYAELLKPLELQWFLGVGFQVNGDIWCVAIQGTPRRGPFLQEDAHKVLKLREHIGVAAMRSALSGLARTETWTSSFESTAHGVIGLDAFCRVISVSPGAETFLDGPLTILRRRLGAADLVTDHKLSALLGAACCYNPWRLPAVPRPVTVYRDGALPLVVEAVPMPRDYQTMFSGTVALAVIREADDRGTRAASLLCSLFELTPAEVRLALKLASGSSLTDAASELAITRGTARVHLRSIFAKTDTHRQAEIVSLIARLQE